MIHRFARLLGLQKDEANILVVGLDDSGKSCIINHLKTNSQKKKRNNQQDTFESTPTVGFQKEEFATQNIKFQVFDMSGQTRYRNMWETYYRDAQAILFVVDSSDRLRFCAAKEELEELLSHKDIQGNSAPLLIYANKMDISGAMTAQQCLQEMELDQIQDRDWHIVSSNGVTGDGIETGVSWLCDNIRPTLRRNRFSRK